MRVRRFVGDNVAEAMGKVKKELGSEAVILLTREIREGGFFGFFGRLKVEITAAIEEKPVKAQPPTGITPPKPEPPTPSRPGPGTYEQPGILQTEIKSVRQMLEKLNNKMEGFGEIKGSWPPNLQKWADHLQDRGICENLVDRLLSNTQHNLPEKEWGNEVQVYSQIESDITEICKQTSLIQPGLEKARVIALIGPTGVGKTTTIGKLAAGFSIVDKRKVALITADTYRVAAVEQLKTFGEIIGVPVEVVMTPSELQQAVELHMDKELIFIDTAGRSPHNELYMSELRAYLDKVQPDFSLLVMSATTQPADQLKICQRFNGLATHLIFTKLDETASAGSILNTLAQVSIPTAYVTNGQNVPDDIVAVTPRRLARFVLGEEMPVE